MGGAKGFEHIVGIFPGTGIGGGLILDGQLYRGARGGAGEIGHMVMQLDGPLCGCGNRGCVEALASRTALTKDVASFALRGLSPKVEEKAGTDIAKIKSKVIARAFEENDTIVKQLVHQNAKYLGVAMGNCVNIFNPEVIVIGGGLIEKLGKAYLKIAEESMLQNSLEHLAKGVKVVAAELGDDAVCMGAGALFQEFGPSV